jgi:hypothetical protein
MPPEAMSSVYICSNQFCVCAHVRVSWLHALAELWFARWRPELPMGCQVSGGGRWRPELPLGLSGLQHRQQI